MPVRPVLRPLLSLSNALARAPKDSGVTARRAAAAKAPLQMRTITARGSWTVANTDHPVPVAGGAGWAAGEITVRVYRVPGPALLGAPQPAHLFIHGGSFWLGSVDEYDPLCRWYAGAAGCVVISVEYRLAPEFAYPTAPEDCYAALLWTVDHAGALHIDPDRISVGGVSAGGGLAASVTLMSRDRSGPAILFQALEIPSLDFTLSQPSIDEFGRGHLLTRESLVEGYGFCIPDLDRRREPYASPLLAENLSGLPPAFILTAECDPLRDEGEAYGARLRAAGGAAVVHRAAGHLHGSIYLTRFLPSARQAVNRTTAALRAAYASSA